MGHKWWTFAGLLVAAGLIFTFLIWPLLPAAKGQLPQLESLTQVSGVVESVEFRDCAVRSRGGRVRSTRCKAAAAFTIAVEETTVGVHVFGLKHRRLEKMANPDFVGKPVTALLGPACYQVSEPCAYALTVAGGRIVTYADYKKAERQRFMIWLMVAIALGLLLVIGAANAAFGFKD